MLSKTLKLIKGKKSFKNFNNAINLGANTQIIRYYSQHNWKDYNKSSCDIESVLESGKSKFPQIFTDSSVEFTAVENSVQKKDELKWTIKGFGRYKGQEGKSAGDLILYGVDRRSLQITGSLIPLLVITPPKNNDYGAFVREFHEKHILPVVPQISMESQRQKTFNWVYDVLSGGKQDQHPQIPKYYNKFYAELIKRSEKGIIDESDSVLSELAMTHLADELLKNEVDRQLYALSESIIESLLQQGIYRPLPLVSPIDVSTFIGVPEEPPKSYPDRFTVLMAGGPGSGKSITTESFALQLQRQTGYALDELALLTVDRQRTIFYEDECVKGAHKKYIGTLTHAEAVVTYNMSGAFLTRRMDENKRVPNVFKEMCNIWPKWLDIGLKKDGTYLITVSTRKPENAVDGVIQRGIQNNDFVTPPEYVLSSYRSVSERFPLTIQENQSKKVIISVVNNELAIEKKFGKEKEEDSQAEDNKPAVVVDCETNTIYIINLLQYVDFINQSQINTKAASESELFEGADLSIETSMARIINPDNFGSTKIAFVRQDITSTSINSLENNVAATIVDGKLNVQNEEDFGKLQSSTPEHFEALDHLVNRGSLKTSLI